jgi:ABC transporter transmembrane region
MTDRANAAASGGMRARARAKLKRPRAAARTDCGLLPTPFAMHRREEDESEAAVLAERLLAEEEPAEDVEAPPASSAMAPLDEKKPGGASLRAGWFRIMQEARHVRPQLLVGCLFLVGGSVSKNALPFLSGRLLDCVTEGTAAKGDAAALSRAHHKLNVVCLQLAGGALVTGVLSAIRAYLFNSASERVVAAVRSKLFRSLLRQELAFYDVNTSVRFLCVRELIRCSLLTPGRRILPAGRSHLAHQCRHGGSEGRRHHQRQHPLPQLRGPHRFPCVDALHLLAAHAALSGNHATRSHRGGHHWTSADEAR